jgi:hypothetical protein
VSSSAAPPDPEASPRWRLPVPDSSRRLTRRLTARLRLLPDFLVVGAQRAGTTSLYQYLVAHPPVGAPLRKEVHFFDLHYGRGLGWYRSHFPLRARRTAVERSGRRFVCGEASPYYLYHPAAAERAARTVPDARLLAILRNPVDRAFSHYHHERERGREPLSFEEALAREPERLAGQSERVAAGGESEAHRVFSYLARGRYAEQLEPWLARFPRDRLLVLGSEAFYADPRAAMARVFAFLGLPPHEGSHRAYNANRYAPMDPAMRRKLLEFFAPENERLFTLLGERFDWKR